jgi:hypothetical protein
MIHKNWIGDADDVGFEADSGGYEEVACYQLHPTFLLGLFFDTE